MAKFVGEVGGIDGSFLRKKTALNIAASAEGESDAANREVHRKR